MLNRNARRATLFASVATACLAGAAHAQSAPEGSYLEAQNGSPAAITSSPSVVPVQSILEPQVVVSEPGTPTTDLDPKDVTGIGQMVIDQQNGYIGLCTGTLINPRTVILAAHCVNENPSETAFQDPWGYGAANGGIPIAFGFRANNNASGNSAFGQWLNTYQTNVSNYLYNVNQVAYNPASTYLGVGNNFLQGDVAIATLDTPAANVPTWAILLSQLPAPGSLSNTSGTGYHVTIEGYGDNGTGPNGDNGQGIDFRRRVAENYIGILGSLNDQDGFLFGVDEGLPQNLYQLDFDDPRRGTMNASIYDFNVFKDTALPNEGITAPGDSGGPLILDNTYNQKLVIAVLSGGDRFYAAQNSASYGTTSFYQPLYLFWDWIAANNNYHYVGSKAGNANWTDASHWVTNIDPSYMTIVNGSLVNGVPQYAGDGINGTSGKFGAICNDGTGYSDCIDLSTGTETYIHDGQTDTYEHGNLSGDPINAMLSGPTLDNGLPGATNFVPNDRDPDAATHTRAAYFDVTLGATGTTTLDTAVTVDRLSVIGSGAKLDITSTGSLTSLIDVTQTDGLVNVDGTLSVVGDYLLMRGGLSGNGRINTPFLTSITGMIAPGSPTTIGTLTIGGNLVLSSGNVLLVNIGNNGESDKLNVTGIASVGGSVLVSPVPGTTIHYGDKYTILTAGSVDHSDTKKFTGSHLTPILLTSFIYNATSVQMMIDAGKYTDVVSANSPVQMSYAQLLDNDRLSSYSQLSALYAGLDLQSAATIQSTLEGLAPRTETLRTALGTTAVDNMARFYRDRVAGLHTGSLGGTLAVIGKPFQVASSEINGSLGTPEIRSDAGDGMVRQEGRLPDNMSGYLAGGYLDGRSRPMPSLTPGGHDTFDGYYIAGGIETEAGSHTVVGASLSYTNVKGTTAFAPQSARGELYQGTIYGKLEGKGFTLDGVFSAGLFANSTIRNVSFLGTPSRLTAHDDSLALSGEIGLAKTFDIGSLKLGPRVALRGSEIDFSTTAESGGAPALLYVRHSAQSLQGRAGATLSGGSGSIKPFISAYYVHDFDNQPAVFGANFVGGLGPNAIFGLGGRDKDWGEVSGGLTLRTGSVDLSVSADSTFERTDVSNQSYRGTIAFHF